MIALNSIDEEQVQQLLMQVERIIDNYKWLLDSAHEDIKKYQIQLVALEKRLKTLNIATARKQQKINALEEEILYLSKALSEKEKVLSC